MDFDITCGTLRDSVFVIPTINICRARDCRTHLYAPSLRFSFTWLWFFVDLDVFWGDGWDDDDWNPDER